MSQYHTAQRTRNLYTPNDSEPFKLSRSKIDLFIACPRCFYLDRRLGVGRPAGFPFNLNSAVDHLLKKEFDIHRAKNTTHPLMKKYGINAVPVAHEDLDKWRHNFTGIQYLHKPTNFLVYGAIDDLWARPLPKEGDTPTPSERPLPNPPLVKGRGLKRQGEKKEELEYIVVDYKATSKDEEVNLDADWQISYKRQMEIYQWLLRQNGFKVSDTGYFVYCNGRKDLESFDGKLEFDVKIISYKGDDKWVESEIIKASKCLNANKIPKANPECDYCNYIEAVNSKNYI